MVKQEIYRKSLSTNIPAKNLQMDYVLTIILIGNICFLFVIGFCGYMKYKCRNNLNYLFSNKLLYYLVL